MTEQSRVLEAMGVEWADPPASAGDAVLRELVDLGLVEACPSPEATLVQLDRYDSGAYQFRRVL